MTEVITERKRTMKNIKKLALLLAMLMLAAVLTGTLASCKKDAEGDDTSDSDSDTVTTSGVANDGDGVVDVNWKDYLPKADFDGADVNICVETSTAPQWYLDDEETAQNVFQEEVAKRNAYIENTYNVYLNFTLEGGDWAGFHQVCQTNLWAGEAEFDVIAPRYYYMCDTAGYFMNLKDVDAIHLDNPYWLKGWNDNTTINNKIFTAATYINLAPANNTVVLFVNNYYAEDLQIDVSELKEKVYAGDWTLEEMNLLMRAGTSDNGDGVWDFKDKYGLAYSVWGGRAMLVASGFKLSNVSATTNEIEWTVTSERNVSVFQELYKFFNNDVLAYYGGQGTDSTSAEGDVNLFLQGRALFWAHSIGQSVNVSKNIDSFSILPLPKFDDKQDDYISTLLGTNVVGIMKNAKNPEMSGTILEAMSILSYVDVLPVYYEEMLKIRYQSDPETGKMLDFINEKIDIDFAFINSSNFDGIAEKPFNMIVAYDRNYVSGMNKITSNLSAKMESFYEIYTPDTAEE